MDLYFNGIDLDQSGLGDSAYRWAPRNIQHFLESLPKLGQVDPLITMDVIDGVDPLVLSSAGWGVISHEDEDPSVLEALSPLLRHRESLAKSRYFPHLKFQLGDDKDKFLQRYGAGQGDVNPNYIPYYLLIIGDADLIPFSFQVELDVNFAVGRLAFPTPECYANYAKNLVAYETSAMESSKRLLIFSPSNGDFLSSLSRQYLVDPLEAALNEKKLDEDRDWTIEKISAEQATYAKLVHVLTSPPPSVLFTAGHGATASKDPIRRESIQGGLVCSDWNQESKAKRSDCFCAEDLPWEAQLTGMVSFQFACYSAGTPEYGAIPMPGEDKIRLHHKPFVAKLPQAMLGGKTGALAVIGHVDQAFQHSFFWDDEINEIDHFSGTLAKILRGCPVGWAMEHFNRRWADIAVRVLNKYFSETATEPKWELQQWLAYMDARNYIVLGDPAARLNT